MITNSGTKQRGGQRSAPIAWGLQGWVPAQPFEHLTGQCWEWQIHKGVKKHESRGSWEPFVQDLMQERIDRSYSKLKYTLW